MIVGVEILVPIAATLSFYVLFHGARIAYHELTSPLRRLSGPRSPSFFTGNFKEMMADPELGVEWRKMFGSTFLLRGLFSISELHTSDIKAINHIISKSTIYRKAPFARENSRQLMGDGILSVELHDHDRFRRILNPAFSISEMRVLTEIFMEKSIQLRDIWARKVKEGETGRIEVLSWLRLMTLEIIGKAGFNYEFEALSEDPQPNELDQVLKQIFMSPSSNNYLTFRFARSLIPILRFVPLPGQRLFLAARSKMREIGRGILKRSKASMNASDPDQTFAGKRDILSVLLKANMSPDVPPHQRLSDTELISQIPTFFVAGHETTSTAASWALYQLSVNQEAQKKLREELLSISTDNPTMDELNSLIYLERVVRETLRVHTPVTFRHRTAMQDDVLPLSKPCVDKDGKTHDSLLIPKGQTIHIPVLAINTDPELWGPDAAEWRPERWEDLPSSASSIPGVWANMLTFFAGPHSCIGFRFAVLELKAMLFTIVRAFEIERDLAAGKIGSSMLPHRPIVLVDGSKKAALPLILKPYDSTGF